MLTKAGDVDRRGCGECPRHGGRPLFFFCRPCRVPICGDCTVIDHRESTGHVVVDIAAADGDARAELAEVRATAERELAAAKRRAEECRRADVDRLEASRVDFLDQIASAFDICASMIATKRRRLNSYVEKTFAERVDKMAAVHRSFAKTIDRAEVLLRRCDDALGDDDGGTAATLKKATDFKTELRKAVKDLLSLADAADAADAAPAAVEAAAAGAGEFDDETTEGVVGDDGGRDSNDPVDDGGVLSSVIARAKRISREEDRVPTKFIFRSIDDDGLGLVAGWPARVLMEVFTYEGERYVPSASRSGETNGDDVLEVLVTDDHGVPLPSTLTNDGIRRAYVVEFLPQSIGEVHMKPRFHGCLLDHQHTLPVAAADSHIGNGSDSDDDVDEGKPCRVDDTDNVDDAALDEDSRRSAGSSLVVNVGSDLDVRDDPDVDDGGSGSDGSNGSDGSDGSAVAGSINSVPVVPFFYRGITRLHRVKSANDDKM